MVSESKKNSVMNDTIEQMFEYTFSLSKWLNLLSKQRTKMLMLSNWIFDNGKTKTISSHDLFCCILRMMYESQQG